MWTARQALQGRQHLDRRMAAIGPAARFAAPRHGWLRAIREALGMSAPVLAKRLGVSAQAVRAMEANEVDGRIRVDTLRRAAEAMDCVFVYALLPRTSLQEQVERQAHAVAASQHGATATSMALEGQTAKIGDDTVRRHAAAILASGRQWRDET